VFGALLIGAILLLVEWPWLLGTWIAVKFGASMDSPARTAAGWALEIPYLILVVLLIAGSLVGKRDEVDTSAPESSPVSGPAAATRPGGRPSQRSLHTTATAAGWYPDPLDPMRLRWWTGDGWSEIVVTRPPGV